jgi:hypothetical protein
MVVKSMSAADFANVYGAIEYFWDSGSFKFYQRILEYQSSDPTNWKVSFRRAWESSSWGSFEAVTGQTKSISGDYEFSACWKDVKYYTGSLAPSGHQENFRVHGPQWVFDGTNVFNIQSDGLAQPSADLNLVCSTYCKRNQNGNCNEWSQCPKQSLSGQTPGQSGSYYQGSSATSVEAYQYKWKISDVNVYTTTDNDKGTISETAVDARTGVDYSSNSWAALEAEMFPSSSTSDFDTVSEVSAYKKVSGNVFYKVGFGNLGSYRGWSWYPKKTDGNWQTLTSPLTCTITMSTAADLNGGSDYNGVPFNLAFYDGYTQGLNWEQAKLYNSDVGQRDFYVPTPQIKDGTACISGATTYRIKADAKMIIPSEKSGGCTAFNSMVSAGTLPTTASENNNRDTTTPSTTKVCITAGGVYSAQDGCTYVAGTTSTAG